MKEVYYARIRKKIGRTYIVIALLQAKLAEKKE
jgi:hypothetical protein